MPRQLRMLWPVTVRPPEVTLPEGYAIRSFREGDEENYIALLNDRDLGHWTAERLQSILTNPLSPKGVYFVTWNDIPIATACAQDHSPDGDGKRIGELGWLAANPEHKGKKLGMAVCAAVVNHLLELEYDEIYLLTDHWRYPALKTYLKLGFEPILRGPDDRYIWGKIYEQFGWKLPEPKIAKHIKSPSGEEIAWRTLKKEHVEEPCIIASWCMKREFFQSLTHRKDIYEDSPNVVIEAFIRAGANLCPQFIMPSPNIEHIACDPFGADDLRKPKPAPPSSQTENVRFAQQFTSVNRSAPQHPSSPEDVRDRIESLPDPKTLECNFDVEAHADGYARSILNLRDMARGEILFISGFGQADFMGGYGWGYENYLGALALYPEHLERYFAYTGEQGRLANISVARAIKKYNLAPYVYSGQDICYNDGPLCSVETLDKLYFPNLAKAVEPLHEAGIGIIWHCDGDVRPILKQLIEVVGVAGFQGFQEETGCTLERVASHQTRKGEKLILWGSISVTTTLPFGTVEDVKKNVERCFRVAAPGGGFALASTSSILPETPLENILAIYEHGQNFGRKFLASN
jgi:GNAT superfamily N-acetyltransferase